jgi:hypothetical protein
MRECRRKAMLAATAEAVPIPRSRGGRISNSVSMNEMMLLASLI